MDQNQHNIPKDPQNDQKQNSTEGGVNSAPAVPPAAESAATKASAAPQTPPAQALVPAAADAAKEDQTAKKEAHEKKKKEKAEAPRKPRKKHYVLRVIGALLRFILTLLLGMAIAYASIVGAVYYAFSGLTIKDLQALGIATNADQYLTHDGDVDLTDTSILELIADFNAIRAELGNHTLQTLIDHYGIALPEETLAVLPTDLFSVPLNTLMSSEAGTTIAQNLKFGYILSFLPEAMLDHHVIDTLADRPLALLTNGQYGELFEGVKLGYFTGVTFDAEGNVQPVDPEHLTMQEAMAELDLGHLLTATTQNGDLLGVLATDLGDQEIRPILSGMMQGALLEKMTAGRYVKDAIVLDPATGRYTFSLPALSEGLYLGDVLNYTLIDDTWYTAYTDDDVAENDVKASAMHATLADIPLADLINGTVSIEGSFDGVYFGDLQSGYERGAEITETDAESGEPVVVGYHWLKNGVEVGKMQSVLANIALNTVIGGQLDIDAVLGSLHIGDLQGYTYREMLDPDTGAVVGHKWVKTGTDGTEAEVSSILAAVADISLSDILSGKLDIVATLGDLTLGEVQGYALGADGRWYREVAVAEGEPTLEYVGAVQNGIAAIPLSDVLGGKFSIATALEGLRMGDAMNYERGEVYAPADPENEASYDKYVFFKPGDTPAAVTGTMLEIANMPLTDVLEGRADFQDTVKSMTLAEVLEYTKGEDGTWYSVYVAEGHAENVRVTGILAVLADKKINELNSGTIDSIVLGEVLGYKHCDDNSDGTPDTWYDNGEAIGGMMATLADLTVGNLSDDDVITQKLRELTLADAMGYVNVDGVWYSAYSADGNADNDIALTGILTVLATKQLGSINAATIDGILLGEALGYTYVDTDSDGTADTWYNGDTPAAGIMAKMADLTIAQLKSSDTVTDKLGEVQLSEVLNYKYVNGQWLSADNKPASGVMAHLMGITIDNVEHEIDEMPLGYAFGFYRDEDTGKWYTDAALTTAPTGITAALADIHLTHAREEFDVMTIGSLLGYTFKDTDGDTVADTWYNGDAVLGGLNLVFADMPISDLSNADKIASAMQQAKLGDSLGLKKLGDTWYKTKIENDQTVIDTTQPVTGLIAALADCKIGSIETEVQSVKIGSMLNFTENNGTWYDADNAEVVGMLAVLAGSDLDHLDDDLKNMTIADIFPEREGILKALDGSTKINELDSAINNCTIESLMNAGVLTIDTTKQAIFANALGEKWAQNSVIDFLNYLINGTLPS